jgi:hypothetical protein
MTTMVLPDVALDEAREAFPAPTCVFTASLMYRLTSEPLRRAPIADDLVWALALDARYSE